MTIAYQTRRDDEREGVSTAALFIPDAPRPGSPIVAVAHGTVGHSDMCTPSLRDPDAGLALPWVGLGFTTITVDYAGLGPPAYRAMETPMTQRSLFSTARAPPWSTLGETRQIVLVGHSQGGRAVHFAQGLAPTYAPELDVSHAIVFAGGPTAPEMLGAAGARLIGRLPLTTTARAFFAMSVYADFANGFGEDRATDLFAPELREVIAGAMESECSGSIVRTLATASGTYVPPPTVGDLLSEEILEASGIADVGSRGPIGGVEHGHVVVRGRHWRIAACVVAGESSLCRHRPWGYRKLTSAVAAPSRPLTHTSNADWDIGHKASAIQRARSSYASTRGPSQIWASWFDARPTARSPLAYLGGVS